MARECVVGCDSKGLLAASFRWKAPNPWWVSCYIVLMTRA